MALQMAEQEAGDNKDLKDTLGDIGQGMHPVDLSLDEASQLIDAIKTSANGAADPKPA